VGSGRERLEAAGRRGIELGPVDLLLQPMIGLVADRAFDAQALERLPLVKARTAPASASRAGYGISSRRASAASKTAASRSPRVHSKSSMPHRSLDGPKRNPGIVPYHEAYPQDLQRQPSLRPLRSRIALLPKYAENLRSPLCRQGDVPTIDLVISRNIANTFALL
jgi:hypothetical protein